MERKVGSGRKGTVDEEEYLLRSVTKLVDRFVMTQCEFILSPRGPLVLK
jgi:elongator complex protein 1